jgi:hypothetical protein
MIERGGSSKGLDKERKLLEGFLEEQTQKRWRCFSVGINDDKTMNSRRLNRRFG